MDASEDVYAFKTRKRYVKRSDILLKNPHHLKSIFVSINLSWAEISLFMQHFRIVGNIFPQPNNNKEVNEELKDPYKIKGYQGLVLVLPTYNDEDIKAVNDQNNDKKPAV